MDLRVVRVNGKSSPIFDLQKRRGEKWVTLARGERADMRQKFIERTPPAVPTVVGKSLSRSRRAWAWLKRVFGVAR